MLCTALLMPYIISVPCSIEAQAYAFGSYGQTFYAYVKLNGVAVWQASWRGGTIPGEYPIYRGANIIIVDRSTCTLQEWRNFDTSAVPNAASELRDYLQALRKGTVLVGVSCDEASNKLSAAESTLNGLGADVSDVGWRGAWVFVAEIGDPAKTVLDKELTQAAANARQPQISAFFLGT